VARVALDIGLQTLQSDVLILGSMVEKAIHRSIDALVHQDAMLARQIITEDRQINALRFKIEDATLALIATQQPLLHDLRTLAAILNIVTDL
jgi:phosphate transport system protein